MYYFVCIQCTYLYISNLVYTLKSTPVEVLEGPFLISMKLNLGPAAAYPVDNWLIGLIPADFNLNEIKNWLILVISVVCLCILHTK